VSAYIVKVSTTIIQGAVHIFIFCTLGTFNYNMRYQNNSVTCTSVDEKHVIMSVALGVWMQVVFFNMNV